MPEPRKKFIRVIALATLAALLVPSAFVAGCVRTSGGEWYIKSAPLPQGWPELTPVGEVHIREYPQYRAASVTSDQAAGTGRMFNALFDHIKRNDIPMTAPVDMGYAQDHDTRDGMTSMAFLYRTQELGPNGADGQVRVQDVPKATYASTGVRGGYTQKHFEEGMARLNTWIQSQDTWQASGPPRYLGYNGPFTLPFLRYGEVQIPVEPIQ